MVNIGDTVALKSGSPTMTVIKKLSEGMFRCAWFSQLDDLMKTVDFPAEAMVSSDAIQDILDEARAEIDKFTGAVDKLSGLADTMASEDEFEGESALTSDLGYDREIEELNAKTDAAYLAERGVAPI